MKLTYRYTAYGLSGGMMLSNTVHGEWDFTSFEVGSQLESVNTEVKITVLEKNSDSVTIKVAYRKNEKTMTVSTMSAEWFKDDANAYGFAFAFTVRE
jgi:hypothetical protein